MQDVDALDRRGADDLGRKPHRHRARPDDVAHAGFAHGDSCAVRELRVFRKARHRRLEGADEIEKQARASGAVVSPLAAARRTTRGSRVSSGMK